MRDNHKLFKSHLEDSREAVSLVAEWLRLLGHSVKILNSTVAEKASDWQNHTDDGDLEVGKDIKRRVEVKKRKFLQFTCREDFPYPTLMVGAAHSFDNADPKPYAYITLNKDASHAAIVYCRDHSEWTVGICGDARYGEGYTQRKYFSPINLVRFLPLPPLPPSTGLPPCRSS